MLKKDKQLHEASKKIDYLLRHGYKYNNISPWVGITCPRLKAIHQKKAEIKEYEVMEIGVFHEMEQACIKHRAEYMKRVNTAIKKRLQTL